MDDEPSLVRAVAGYLEHDGFVVTTAADGEQALAAARRDPPDIVVLDLMLPDIDGLEVARRLREAGERIPVLMLTARDGVADRVRGLDAGADDYHAKPFAFEELLARVRALLRRRAGRATPSIQHGNLILNPATHEASLRGKELALSAKEFALLAALLDQPGMVLSRAQLEEKLYGWNGEIESNAVEVYIHSLRKKLGKDFIKNIRGVGYMARKPR